MFPTHFSDNGKPSTERNGTKRRPATRSTTLGGGQATVRGERRSKGGPLCGGFSRQTGGETKGIFPCGRRGPSGGPRPDTAGDAIHTPENCRTGAQTRGTQTAHQNMDMRDTRTPPLQGMRNHTPGGQALLLSGTSGAPSSAHGVPSGCEPYPSTHTGGRRISQRTPMGRGGGSRAAHPRPPNGVCCARRREGAHPGGCRGPQARQVKASRGTRDSGDTNPPSPRVSARANGHA